MYRERLDLETFSIQGQFDSKRASTSNSIETSTFKLKTHDRLFALENRLSIRPCMCEKILNTVYSNQWHHDISRKRMNKKSVQFSLKMCRALNFPTRFFLSKQQLVNCWRKPGWNTKLLNPTFSHSRRKWREEMFGYFSQIWSSPGASLLPYLIWHFGVSSWLTRTAFSIALLLFLIAGRLQGFKRSPWQHATVTSTPDSRFNWNQPRKEFGVLKLQKVSRSCKLKNGMVGWRSFKIEAIS